MADGVDHIDIYADVEEEFSQNSITLRSNRMEENKKMYVFSEPEYPPHEQIDLYGDVESPSANNGDAPEDRDYLDSLPAPGGSEGGKSAPPNVVYTYTGKRIALYIGNLTWWTTDEDLTEAIRSVGITDVLEIKFFENRANGQSKGFALVCVGSEASSRKLMDLLSKRELHGQNPIVTPCNKQSLSQFEMQSRKSNQSGQMSGEGKAGPPGSGSRGGFPMGSRKGRFPGPPGGPPPAPHVNPAFFPPPGGNNMPPNDSRGPPGPNDPYGRPPPYDSRDYGPGRGDMESSRGPLNEAEFEEIMNRNRAISSSAISRAVSDASAADYGSAIETLVTAISLIKQSKVSADDRCKVLISSLQDCLHGIESKSYGSVSRRERSRERDHSRSREKSRRHKSRSRDRHEDYYRERSRERDRHRERDRDRDREREREREYRHR
ncbi:Cleavage and polyadenylation specificity factor subunit 6 [Xenotaenia resolanae]|uniref:Cleavage and polyadenylation specificity factor subunit 6 n=1 Tax=Xenotaenia resolanae TaxID=208358 RepID=A0ABV0W5K4_9TELE